MSLLHEVIKTGKIWAAEKREQYRHFRYRVKMSRIDVHIDRRAMIHGFTGITISSGTRIGPNASIIAGSQLTSPRLYAKPRGHICIGHDCYIHAGAILASYSGEITIGNNVSINPYTILYGHGGLTIGNNTRIAAHTTIIPANHNYTDNNILIRKQGLSAKGITIGNDVWIAAGVKIVDGTEIGDGAVLGAGAVVTRDVPPFTVFAGVPARQISERSHFVNS